ncbi:hypothetical protein CYMTET_54715 [Cymbomonas tetramitiformis]|uniref:Uncharacterized protein n=1 Tax=Cymbomonas tetramitiformis TaxID=36881 RepID=A0AAE0BG65_9CHLO|nr:hypothetical protein CYMTET_54715 [Cymbomonas tetramitiformis]
MSIRWCGKLGDGQCTELATRMQAEVRGAVGVSPRQLRAEQVKAQKLREFGGREGREWLPASEESTEAAAAAAGENKTACRQGTNHNALIKRLLSIPLGRGWGTAEGAPGTLDNGE